jgi:hypothetical protein
MYTKAYKSALNRHSARGRVALVLVAMLAFGNLALFGRQDPTATAQEDAPKIPNEQLDTLVAPIALYPDPLLSQILVASTYPLEIVQLQQWLEKTGSHMNETARAEAVQKQDWDPSIQAMAVLPEVVKRLADGIKWTSDLGNAFLAQQADVMDAVQRMRAAAKDKGSLKPNEQMNVETKQVEGKTVVVIEQADPQVVYVPSYNPMEVWGDWGYPYPPVYYPPAGYYAGRAIGFAVGVAIGAAWGGGGWGWGCGWGGNNVNINVNNNFVRNSNINRGNVNNINRGGNTWQHNPQHRGGAPYANKATASKYGGSARGDSMSSRQANARQNAGQMGGGDRGSGGRQASTSDRGGGGSSSGFGGAGGGGDRIGSRETSKGGGGGSKSKSSSSFGGGSYGGSSTRSSSSRGSSSMGGGGMSRGGGGMSRGGGGGRR